MKLRTILGCLVVCAAACGPKATPSGASDPALLCKQVPLMGTAAQGATLVHAATFSMLMIDTCSFDVSKLVDAAKACKDHVSCGLPIGPAGLTQVNQAVNTTWTTVSLGGGRAFTSKLGDRALVAWDASRNSAQVIAAVTQGPAATGGSCCPGCAVCDAGAGTPACPADGGAPPHVDTFPAAGFPDLQGPAVCACGDVCSAQAGKLLPAECECARLCHCQ